MNIKLKNRHKFKLSWTQNNSKTKPTCHSDNATLALLNSTGKNLNTISPSPSLPAAPPSIPDTVSIGHGWLSDTHIDKAQTILKKQFPLIDGFQDTLLGELHGSHGFQAVHGPAVQIIFDRARRHWIVATNIYGNVTVFDSLFTTLDPQVKLSLRDIFRLSSEGNRLQIRVTRIQEQIGADDCGVFAICIAVLLCLGLEPRITLNQNELRSYVEEAFRNEHFSNRIPTLPLPVRPVTNNFIIKI